ncbi:MAG: transglycosylase SLT domain-containing protein [Pseudomonadota bacterium]
MRRSFGLFATAIVLAASAAAAAPTPRLKPEPPGPSAHLSETDLMLLNAVDDAVKKRQWPSARATAWSIQDDVGRSLGQWMYIWGQDPKASFYDVSQFLDAHPDWPGTTRMQRFAERRMREDLDASEVLAFFDKRAPLSGEGKLQFARALFETGNAEVAVGWLRQAWIDHDWIAKTESKILTAYGNWLRPEDHAERVDRLLWERRITDTRRILGRVTLEKKKEANVRIKLMTRAKGAIDAYNALPPATKAHPALIYEAARYLRRIDDDIQATDLLRRVKPNDPRLGPTDKWWVERRILARRALKDTRFVDAYDTVVNHGLSSGASYADAEFMAGWIALRFLGRSETASGHFAALRDGVSTPISRARAYYWLGRAASVQNALDIADANYAQATAFPHTYYGQLAAEELSTEHPYAPLPIAPEAAEELKTAFDALPLVKALHILGEKGDQRRFRIFARSLDDQLIAAEEFVLLAQLSERYSLPDTSVRIAKTAARQDIFLAEYSYPTPYIPTGEYVEPALVLGLSRQESEFNPRAVSRAGARGLMQLLPETARITARKEGLPYAKSWLLNDPDYNIKVGSAHLSHLLDRFDGSYIMTMAGYNAGPHRVDRWVKDYGDPRQPGVDPIDWVELIPFSETRNYVQRVMENTLVYRARLTNTPIAWALTADLKRGGPALMAESRPPARVALPEKTAPERQAQAAPKPTPQPTTLPTPQPKAAPQPKATPAPTPKQQAARPAPVAPKTNPNSKMLTGVYETEDCKMFVPDATGGGTCIEPKTDIAAPAAPVAPEPFTPPAAEPVDSAEAPKSDEAPQIEPEATPAVDAEGRIIPRVAEAAPDAPTTCVQKPEPEPLKGKRANDLNQRMLEELSNKDKDVCGQV